MCRAGCSAAPVKRTFVIYYLLFAILKYRLVVSFSLFSENWSLSLGALRILDADCPADLKEACLFLESSQSNARSHPVPLLPS